MKRFRRGDQVRDSSGSTELEGDESRSMPDMILIPDAPGQVKVKRLVVSVC
jgi:hypothetical protein